MRPALAKPGLEERALEERALEQAARLAEREPRLRVAFVTCSYDTAFEPLADQVRERLEGLQAAFGGRIEWSLWIVDDLPPEAGFGAAVEGAFAASPELRRAGRLHGLALRERPAQAEGLKGLALLHGFASALESGPLDALVYLNLNLKVAPCFAALGLAELERPGIEFAIGSRERADGGRRLGAGWNGLLKSRAYRSLARALLPDLRVYADTNGPLKVFSARAAEVLVRHAQTPGVTLDCEWLVLLRRYGLRGRVFPIVWRQRRGSRPPWHLAPQSALELVDGHRGFDG